MARHKPPAEDAPGDEQPPKKAPHPSRQKTAYVGIPQTYYQALERYARDKSDEDTERSIAWAARKAVRKFLEAEGYWPPPADPPDAG